MTGNGVKHSTKIHQDKHSDMTLIWCNYQVTCNFDQCSLCDPMHFESWLTSMTTGGGKNLFPIFKFTLLKILDPSVWG